MRILLAEDDALIASAILSSLRKHDFSVDWVSDGLAVDGAVQAHDYGMLILDLGLPHVDGIEILKRLAQRSKPLPVLVITARGGLDDRVSGLNAGADDYLVKPFELDELVARIFALRRRTQGWPQSELRVGALSVDPRTGHILALSAQSRLLLELDEKGEPVSFISLLGGQSGLESRIPRAEGVAMDEEGTIYMVSEPNLFYVFRKDEPFATPQG